MSTYEIVTSATNFLGLILLAYALMIFTKVYVVLTQELKSKKASKNDGLDEYMDDDDDFDDDEDDEDDEVYIFRDTSIMDDVPFLFSNGLIGIDERKGPEILYKMEAENMAMDMFFAYMNIMEEAGKGFWEMAEVVKYIKALHEEKSTKRFASMIMGMLNNLNLSYLKYSIFSSFPKNAKDMKDLEKYLSHYIETLDKCETELEKQLSEGITDMGTLKDYIQRSFLRKNIE